MCSVSFITFDDEDDCVFHTDNCTVAIVGYSGYVWLLFVFPQRIDCQLLSEPALFPFLMCVINESSSAVEILFVFIIINNITSCFL